MKLPISRSYLRWGIISVGFGLSVGMTYAALSYGGDASFVLGFLLSIVVCLAVGALGATYWHSENIITRDEIEPEILYLSAKPQNAIEFPQPKSSPVYASEEQTIAICSSGSWSVELRELSHLNDDAPCASYEDDEDDQYKWEKLDSSYVWGEY